MAIYVGGDRILHAPRTGDVVRYGTIGEFSGEVMTVSRLLTVPPSKAMNPGRYLVLDWRSPDVNIRKAHA